MCLRGQQEPHFIPRCCKLPVSFLSLDEAEAHLDVLSNAVYRLQSRLESLSEEKVGAEFPNVSPGVASCLVLVTSRTVPLTARPDLRRDIDRVSLDLKGFMSAFAAIHMAGQGERLAVHLKLRMQFFSIWIQASTWRNDYEADCDRFNAEFEHITSVSEQYLDLCYSSSSQHQHLPFGSTASRVPRALFTLESYASLCLFLIAVKCRISKLRRRAVELLRCASLCGLFDSLSLSRYACALVELEEERARKICGYTDDRIEFHSSDIPEEARVVDSVLSHIDKRASTAKLYFAVRNGLPLSKEARVEEMEIRF